MKNYTIESIMEKKCGRDYRDVKPLYTATGYWENHEEKFSLNTSSILSFLIREAGRLCDSYASDLFIDWRSIEDNLSNIDYTGGNYLIGIREYGVDGNSFVLSRLNNAPEYYGMNHYYRAMYAVEILIDADNITMNLWKIAM